MGVNTYLSNLVYIMLLHVPYLKLGCPSHVISTPLLDSTDKPSSFWVFELSIPLQLRNVSLCGPYKFPFSEAAETV